MQISLLGCVRARVVADRCSGGRAFGRARFWFSYSLKIWIGLLFKVSDHYAAAVCSWPGQCTHRSAVHNQAVLLFKTTWRISTGLLAVVEVILGWYALSIYVCLFVCLSKVGCPVLVCLFVCLLACLLVPWGSECQRYCSYLGPLTATAAASCGKANMLFSFCKDDFSRSTCWVSISSLSRLSCQ